MREIKEGDFVILNRKIGYTAMACSDAMEVMEVHKGGLTAKCARDGCMTKPLSHFVKVENIDKFKVVHRLRY